MLSYLNRNFTVVDQGPAISESEIAVFEKKIGESLPDDFREYMLKYNGGGLLLDGKNIIVKIDWQGKDPQEGGSGAFVEYFHEFSDDTSSGLEMNDCYQTFKDRIPDDTISIAHDPGGSLFLIGVKGKNRGKVFFWSRDYEDINKGPDGSPTYDNVGFVSNSFKNFLEKLEPEPDDWDEWEELNG
jgi:hypothetical protein